ncbi:LPS-assembly protein LptD [Halomonas huangheensis]|uniref:LPS-assembly protein LptD n=1 Tax=Halomonas huangheensis TaxID=1178482 RepID=W1N4J7_9GAMM|nr:LPS-assembly protein LptD [Halomonas huangheensis]ALM51613.1 LPS biosynthesis protein [Halomonas huangheensis]ERL50096.1 hypothetical protein BJB45_02940 [Halomonas huangheensis]
MAKREAWMALAGLATTSMISVPVWAEPPQPLPASQLDWVPWGTDRPAGEVCGGYYLQPEYRLARPVEGNVSSESDTANYGAEGDTILQGEVLLRKGDTQLEAPRVQVPPERDVANINGPVTLRDQGLLVRGDDAQVSLKNDEASINSAHYVAHESRIRGDAVQLERITADEFRLHEASFTTCAPGDSTWRLIGNQVDINRAAGYGTARHARLEIADVPVFYWPWVRFPIDDRRQSGFLWPALSGSDGALDFEQPYYLNLAPNYDATISPRWVGDSGVLFGAEFRYLTPNARGTVAGAYLADDQSAGEDDGNTELEEGDDRWYFDYSHQGRLSKRVPYRLRYGAASDGAYFDDFGRTFGESSTDNMPRLARIDYRGDVWKLQARAQGYQVMDDPLNEKDKPFYRLPSLDARARWSQDTGLYQEWNSNLTYFWRDIEGDENGRYNFNGTTRRIPITEAANGMRLSLSPAFGYRYDPGWGFFKPRVALHHTQYDLDYQDRITDRSDTPSITVPVSSIDTGLVFERDVDLGGSAFMQTLEPRLNYAYVPAEDQSEFPDFDTAEQSFSWNQLWSPYRFSGGDRIGDLNRFSYGVESRFLEDESGRERFSVGIGQSAYFEDRNIDMQGDPDTLPSDEDSFDYYEATRDRSPWVTRINWQVTDNWKTRWQWLYDDYLDRTESTSVGLQWRGDAGHVVNLGYRWRIEGFDAVEDAEDRLNYNREEYDLSFALKATDNFDVIGRLLYDHTNDRALDQMAGVQWNDCCYGVQLVWREWIDDEDTANNIEDDTTDRGFFLRFVLKGLGGVGGEADSYFESAIPGYRSARLE